MAKKLTTSKRIRNYLKKHPDAQPRTVAEALGVKVSAVYYVQNYDRQKEKAVQGFIQKIQMFEPPADAVNHPPHYKVGGIETIDFIEAKKLNYNLGNVVKYIARADHKNNRQQDLEKAMWYLTRELGA